MIDLDLHSAGLDHFHHVARHPAACSGVSAKWKSVGRVITSEPLLDSVNGSIGGIGPEALPNVTKRPLLQTVERCRPSGSLIESQTTGSISPLVIFRTRSTKFSRL